MIVMSKLQMYTYVKNKIKKDDLKGGDKEKLVQCYEILYKNQKLNEEQIKFVMELKDKDVQKTKQLFKKGRLR